MNNPFDYTPDAECSEAFRKLVARLEALKESGNPDDVCFISDLEAGKMLGVLIADDAEGVRHTLYAFSGQTGAGEFHYPGFVGPAFDYLQPDGYFKTREAEIERSNTEIASFEEGEYSAAISGYTRMKEAAEAEVAEFREKCRESKRVRDAIREAGVADAGEADALLRRSQFEKAEMRRLKKRLAASVAPYEEKAKEAASRLAALKERRRADSESLQKWLFDSFTLLNARGESRSLSEIFAATPLRTPPSGAGECCAPKLLQAAYLRGWRPVGMAEYWYGNPKGGEVRIHGCHYPACRGKCLPVLGWMLRGLDLHPPLEEESRGLSPAMPEIIFENEWFCVVSKPAGMLSVPGKGAAVSVERWLSEKYGPDKKVRMAHRLDQDTSGLLVAAFGEESLKMMQSLFARRLVGKTYVAELEGDYESRGLPRKGHISLPLSPDWLDRPRQRIDFDGGKEAETDYEFTGVAEGRSRILFYPLTGRTHQLRVHAASESGLGMPIAGDRLYGMKGHGGAERLLLHAHRLEFTFPADGRHYSFVSPVPF